jgi:hypothetical protein
MPFSPPGVDTTSTRSMEPGPWPGWIDLQSRSRLEDAREQIRSGIRAGTIRVVPQAGDSERIQIIPIQLQDV